MAYRRKHGNPRTSTFEDFRSTDEPSSPSSLAAQAIRASSAHRDSSLSSAYGESAYREPDRPRFSPSPRESSDYEYTSMKSLNEAKYGFWGVLARKAKAILDDDNAAQQLETPGRTRPQVLDTSTGGQFHQSQWSAESYKKENPKIQKGLDAITSSLNYIGGTIGKSLEEGLTNVERKTADIIQETKRLNIRRKAGGNHVQNPTANFPGPHNLSQMQTDQETQLKASRDVANAMAAKAKLLMRELKTVKADLAFAKERCAQLEEENKVLRECREKGDNSEDDDLIRLQLETLLAEKARLAHENSVYARENRFLREIVEYHQLTMQDVVYLDEGIEEVTEVYPIQIPAAPMSSWVAPADSPSVSPSSSYTTSFVPDPTALPIPTPPPASLNTTTTAPPLARSTSIPQEASSIHTPPPAAPAQIVMDAEAVHTNVETHSSSVNAGEDLKPHNSMTSSK